MMWKWISSLFKKEEDEVDLEGYELFCPECGSDKLVYTDVVKNFVQVVQGTEDPQYETAVRCMKCSFKEIYSEPKDLLKVLKVKKKGE